jgi:hypothetical protein
MDPAWQTDWWQSSQAPGFMWVGDKIFHHCENLIEREVLTIRLGCSLAASGF